MISELGLEALFDNASIGIVVINSKGEILAVNKHLSARFKYSKEELTGRPIELLIPARFAEMHVNHRAAFFSNPENRPMGIGRDLYAITKEGEEFPVELSLTHYTANGTHYAAAYISDISKRKAAEKALKVLNAELDNKISERTKSFLAAIEELGHQIKQVEAKDKELQKANSYLESIWNYAGAMIIATDIHGNIELFNHAAEKLLGYRSAEIVGRQTPLLFHDIDEVTLCAKKLSEELGMDIEAGFETFVAKARRNITDQGEWTYIDKRGKRFPVDLSITALKNINGEITGFLGVAIDISQRKKAEVELKAALQKEKELNELKSRFVSIASHEFRTPLSTILSSAYLISQYKTAEDDEKRGRHIDRIISSANMLTDILNDFLSVGKIEEGKIQVREKEVNIKEYLPSLINELQGLRKKSQFIEYDHQGNETVHTDPSILKHIIFNLVSNAVKFSPEDGRIEIKTRQLNRRFTLNIKDNGIGIPEEDQRHLFDLFYRGSNVSNIQGTGLGLHIIKRYTEILGGTIQCESKENEGTKFEIAFKQ
jgi:PAS domain S-box-containing protein